MSLQSLTIRFQSAGMIPPPYTHFYTLTATPKAGALHVDFSITYTDRENLDEEDIAGEGFTLTDDFSWSGTLGEAWLPVVEKLASQTQLKPLREDKLTESDDFLEVIITRSDQNTSASQPNTPREADAFLYPVQELIQAIYEAGGKEKPFELTYLSYQQLGDSEVNLRASFANRSVDLITIKKGQETRKTMPWDALQALMSTIYAYDYNPEDGMPKPPRKDGHYLSMGTGDWYAINAFTEVHRALGRL